MGQKYARYGTESKLKTLEKAIEIKRKELANYKGDKNSFEYNNLKKTIKLYKGQITNLRYVLKRMGSKNEVELPQSVLPRSENEYVIGSNTI